MYWFTVGWYLGITLSLVFAYATTITSFREFLILVFEETAFGEILVAVRDYKEEDQGLFGLLLVIGFFTVLCMVFILLITWLLSYLMIIVLGVAIWSYTKIKQDK